MVMCANPIGRNVSATLTARYRNSVGIPLKVGLLSARSPIVAAASFLATIVPDIGSSELKGRLSPR
jgi:hypothetical protein